MARWQPGAPDRLRDAALALFAERGYDQTTVADIAARAGLTERTFYRHYADKREVLFDGGVALEASIRDAVRAESENASETKLLGAALAGLGDFFPADRRTFSQERQRILDAEPALQEREMLKLARLTAALAESLAGRGIPASRARLVAELTMGVFRASFAQWIVAEPARDLSDIQREALDEWRVLLGA